MFRCDSAGKSIEIQMDSMVFPLKHEQNRFTAAGFRCWITASDRGLVTSADLC